MSIVDKFGEKVGEIAENDPVKARKLLLAGYRLQEKRLALLPDRKLPMSGQYVAKIVMNNIIQHLQSLKMPPWSVFLYRGSF